MEFVGRTLKKEFRGFGVFSGVVKSYDSASEFFEIGYEDGDSEEIEFSELAALLDVDGVLRDHSPSLLANKPSRVGRRPKKRRRVLGSSNSGNENDFSSSLGNAVTIDDSNLDTVVDGELRNEAIIVEKLTKNMDFSGNNNNNINSSCKNANLKTGGLELNCGLNSNAKGNDDGIDLNLDLNEENRWESKKGDDLVDKSIMKERCFDLNMDFDDVHNKNQDVDPDGCLKGSHGESHKREHSGGEVEGTQIEGAALNDSHLEVSGGTDLQGNLSGTGDIAVESRGALGANFLNNQNSSDSQTNNVSIAGVSPVLEYHGTLGKTYPGGRRGRKRRKLSDSPNTAAGSVLRRSARRRAKFSAEDHDSNATGYDVADSAVPSPVASAVSEDQPTISGCEESEEPSILPRKLELPPSTGNINLDGLPVLDLFSVYAFLRSFSTILFLSPFELGDFVASIRSKSPSLLIDSIHVSLLHTLRKHLEFQSSESSTSATNCLRDLNWNLLDLITWPIFMVEYLLMKPGFDLARLKLLKIDYYKQPEFVKVEILQYICDDVIEGEAISSELNRRTLVGEPTITMESDQNTTLVASKKRRATMAISGSSCMSEEAVDETADWNSDECCLCKMDGNLICCDGCPAAFHSKCVGIATNLLPEGDWYCPECLVDNNNPGMNVAKSIRGADLLGVDPHGRLFYSSCGYLLVSDLCDAETSFHYYHMNDLTALISALNLLNGPYRAISNTITKYWHLYKKCYVAKSKMDSANASLSVEPLLKVHMPNTYMATVPCESSEICAKEETLTEEKPGHDGSNMVNAGTLATKSAKLERPLAPSAGSSEISEAFVGTQKFLKSGLDSLNGSAGVPQNPASVGDPYSTPSKMNVEQRKKVASSNYGCDLSKTTTRKGMPQQLEIGYLNLYSFARVASSVAGEWTRKPSDKISQTPTKSLEELISAQMKAISRTSIDFCWSNIQNLSVDARKEKCGWCLSCKFPTDDGNCLFVMNNTDVLGSYTSNLLGFGSRISRKDRLVDVMCHILCIEDRLHGLLLGPWLNPHFPKLYRKRFLEASDIASVKDLLLMLESNIRLLALSDEWLKHVDSVVTVGSASHFVTSKLRMPSRNVIGRKRSRSLDTEPHASKNASSGLGLFWWRGGRLTRKLFSWKVLPHSLACKAARQVLNFLGGGKKIDGILYPENSDFPKRSKALAWRASVESATTVEHLALQVREFDSNIKWEEIENTSHLAKMDKESIKSMRSFKKSIIRRKCSEGAAVKYLLDFGKRRFIPDTVVKHGSKLEESSSGRKKYWLEEPYVPLFLLKAFEDRRIAFKSNKTSPGSLPVNRRMLMPSKKVGFSYLFSKAEKPENHWCAHCNKDVPLRDAISCQSCEGVFHKRHVKKTSEGLTAKCTYTCHKCHGGDTLKIIPKKGKMHSRKTKKASNIVKPVQSKTTKRAGKGKQLQGKGRGVAVPLRRSARTAKIVSLQSKKKRKKKQPKKKQVKSADKKKQLNSADDVKKPKGKRGRPRKIRKESFQKKRSQMQTTYWLRGLLLSRKPDDERVTNFRTRNHLVAFDQLASITNQPKCSLCHEPEFRSSLNYISCETCGDWYHGDAFGLQDEHIGFIIGFKCHKCRERAPPVCPHLHPIIDESQKDLLSDDASPKQPHAETKSNSKEDHGPESAIIEQSTATHNSEDVLQSSLTHNKPRVETVAGSKEANGPGSSIIPHSIALIGPLEDSFLKDFSETGSLSTHNLAKSGSFEAKESSADTTAVVQQEANADCGELVVDKLKLLV
ncbi:DDT domain-containing protein PTM isoform X1 [Cynara cardunculus var. scolymus]|uniref:DDT domain-containing protein PTM isoform X1 n=1 Tax=Cynara cardunculus var. scolymus TaxID=59895 RepID=UPI000D6288A2|nr:DDT domain-containing protein PTM isoform X1 [Cynara cardunculus var. scolymus]